MIEEKRKEAQNIILEKKFYKTYEKPFIVLKPFELYQ